MKISKFGGGRTAVGIIKDEIKGDVTGGIMYTYPGKPVDVVERLNSKRNSYAILYNIFSNVTAGTAPAETGANYDIKIQNYNRRKSVEKALKGVNAACRRILFYEKRIGGNSEILKRLGAEKIIIYGVSAEEFVSLALRKSLSAHKAGAIAFLKNAGKETLDDRSRKDIITFLDAVRKDYLKLGSSTNYSQSIVKSIKNQNLTVQLSTNDGGIDSLSLPVPPDANKKTNHKNEEKEALNAFLSLFANLREEQRTDCLRKIRRLLDLFFSAPTVSDDRDVLPLVDTTNFDVWAKHEEGKLKTGYFVRIPEELAESWKSKKRLDSIKEKQLSEKLSEEIKKRNMACYRYSLEIVSKYEWGDAFFSDNNINKFWIHHIENSVERLLKQRISGNLFKLENAYLCEKIWKDVLNYLSIKYIAIGKALFNFAENSILGELPNTPKDGRASIVFPDNLNSFDYEMIKARETLQREMAVYVAFATRNFSGNTVTFPEAAENKDDILLWLADDFCKYKKYEDPKKELTAILAFFGGKSSWDSSLFLDAYSSGKHAYDVALLNDIKESIYSLRNETFHFKTYRVGANNRNNNLFGKMFEIEASKCFDQIIKRVYSNNLPMFYAENDIKTILDRIYAHPSERASQVPAFNHVVKRLELRKSLKERLGIVFDASNSEVTEKWESACFYILKEIYYNDFLQNKDVKTLFSEAVNSLSRDQRNNQNAVNDFKRKCRSISEKKTFSEICQILMTEYNLQNSKNRKVQSSSDSLLDKKIYQHYKLLLEKALSLAFFEYVNSEKAYEFLKSPVERKMPSEETYMQGWRTTAFDDLTKKVMDNPELQKWFIFCHFLNGRSLNLMAGSMRSYIQYVKDILARAASTGNKLHIEENEKVKRIETILPVVQICIELSGKYTNNILDYFEDEDEFAQHLGRYVDFVSDETQNMSLFEQLKAFSNKNGIAQGVFVDNKHPIANRNIVFSKLYGSDRVLEETINKIGPSDLEKLPSQRAGIEGYILRGYCKESKEQKKLVEYQRLKNRVELRIVAEYSELINELLGQLINWSFLRERDLLYFQLGFHYMCLNNDSYKPAGYESLYCDGQRKDNVILRQIVGMYINGIGIYCPNEGGEYREKSKYGGVGGKITSFEDYSIFILKEDASKLGDPGSAIYNAGLEVFEVIKEHYDIVQLRNYIDHFKYFSDNSRSILDLYSEVFDRFFTYDMKYRKNVPVLLQNILLRHMVNVTPRFETGEKKVSCDTKRCARIEIERIGSERFTYKLPTIKTKLEMDARDEEYMNTVLRILYYPESVPAELMPKTRAPKETPEDKNKKRTQGNYSKFKK